MIHSVTSLMKTDFPFPRRSIANNFFVRAVYFVLIFFFLLDFCFLFFFVSFETERETEKRGERKRKVA